jgi:hypothetical protein
MRWWLGNSLLETLMWSSLVEVPEILAQYLVEMALAQDKDVIQALASNAPKKALNQRIRTRCPNRCAHDPDPARLGYSRECRSELLGGRWSLLTTASLQNWT